MKVSELLQILSKFSDNNDPHVVTGEEWLPERLLTTKLNEDFLFLHFDQQPADQGGDEEGRGFVEHEISMLRDKIRTILEEEGDTSMKAEAFLALFLIGHERSSSEVIEILEEDAE
ncbi:conserved hypothetical protein [Vibrio nigripulchritudo MADA3029]|uniref:hypothetical protein n=1 Tax=Vibrio TaxID=662 RepID=UPI00021C2341|nr:MULTISPECIES: hypothetical protein [Vibrio]EGU55528.1 hypothetical protein VINI7043_26935 [Vibrio nigripulchritudo ATCC 27043]KJY80796.1 hypothetical protein TW74_00395 [Vibrio nigripulchritudo]UAB68956.1 hypothetical protein INR79_10440 [Vibrio sp. SCSIO 43132]CCN34586.1 conserved hypothetical protein [Vibrio nigripulchritudo AM115]CCN40603.1 conserved hypothetical protein [Vibrio nigripulchritudo FTn2]